MTVRNLRAAIAVASACLVLLASGGSRPSTAFANNAYLHSDGIGFDGIGPSYGWANVYVTTSSTSSYADAVEAIDGWRARRIGNIWWTRHTTNASEAQIQVIDEYSTDRAFGGIHLLYCNVYFDSEGNGDKWAVAIATDDSGNTRGVDSNKFWLKSPGHPFLKGTACLNNSFTNDQGTIAHEIGHTLGLNHVAYPNDVCSDTGLNSVMSYNYTDHGRQIQWPPSPYLPTVEDVWGPWVCNTGFPGGLMYVYQISPTEGFRVDSDGDGCDDEEENGNDQEAGGERNRNYYWDFYDVSDDKSIDFGDTTTIMDHYGDGPNQDPWDNDLDRTMPPVAWEQPWRSQESDTGIDIDDALTNLESWGHSCEALP